jgi:hypothetical protein
MNKTTALSIAGLTLLAMLLIGCGTLGLAVRLGMVREQVLWFPPGTRYQLIVRIGNDAPPWSNPRDRPTAINLWVHGRGTDWHYVNLVHIPLGRPIEERRT